MIQVRACEGFDEFEACVQLQIETWGYDESEMIPRKTFLLAQKIGGQVVGAFDTDGGSGATRQALIGFAMSLPGVKSDGSQARPYLHSHMLAVREGYRNRGLGVRLKREQRLEAISRGIFHMEWTFDPLEIKNAFLNIHRLGAVVRAYRPDFYGVSSSRLQGGLPTDRLLAEWELVSHRVEAILDGRPTAVQAIEERIVIPAAIYQWKASNANRARALAVQLENRTKFQEAFSRGLAVVGFSLDAEGNGTFELAFPGQPGQVFKS
ncbi:MAG TPA: GNAT family N-acetyltransferase [Terracidiphilus sp.]|jgi:predicted GNAT superfamily acetyltransferase|nr:GNAT family N-acetyltransferase [Terracidiphilus sp.]